MSDENHDETTPEAPSKPGRRGFIAKTGLAIGGGVVAAQMIGCGNESPATDTNQAATPGAGSDETPGAEGEGHLSTDVEPGQLDDYYGIWSGGQSGEVRILGVPSMRELKRIPVFNRDAATGWGATDWSKELLKGRSSGDTHHVHLSYTDGTYDGRYAYVNDKAQGRLARIRLDLMEVDSIVDIPNSFGTHGIFPQRHRTGLVFCNSEFRAPLPNNGTDMDDKTKYSALHTAIDGESMEVKWQVQIEGNLDLAAADYEGKYSFACCYNSEGGVTLEEMMAADRDYLYVFNLENIENAVSGGNTTTIGDSPVPVVDARGDNGPFVLRIPVPKSPHGVNISPDGRYAICSGKLSPTCTVVDIQKIAQAFAGDIEPRDCVVAEPEVGLGPLHTAFDGRGNAYTSIFIDSVVTKWNIEKAIQKFGGQDVDPIIQKLDVNYQIGHVNASMSETKNADGKWCVALCKFSKDRFLPVGPLHPENDQLIDISGERMRLAHDGATYSEPHDALIVDKSLIHPVNVDPRDLPRYTQINAWAEEDGINLMQDNRVVRKDDNHVRVYMTSRAPAYGMTEFRVKQGDIVTIIDTNQDDVEDLSHGVCVTNHDVNFGINPQGTQSMTFTADKVGLFWYYCPWFCHALHLEMRGRMIVEPR
ncbi:MAG: nitrous-oxide reductase [Deltaproteobacteria bacterium]|nr:nitrous-oxide reductase [Deltaproteobacteria bacterium]